MRPKLNALLVGVVLETLPGSLEGFVGAVAHTTSGTHSTERGTNEGSRSRRSYIVSIHGYHVHARFCVAVLWASAVLLTWGICVGVYTLWVAVYT